MYRKSFFVSIFVLLYTSVNAQEESSKSELERSIEPKISVESSYISDAKVKDSDGSVSFSKNRVEINNPFLGFSYTNCILVFFLE